MVCVCNAQLLEELEKLDRNELICIVDQDHQWWVIVVHHTKNFKAIYLVLNPPLMVNNTENQASLQILRDKQKISGKRYWILLLKTKGK